MAKDDLKVMDTNFSIDYLQERYLLKIPEPSDPSPRITSSFIIGGECLDLDLCSAFIGLTPTQTSADARALPAAVREIAAKVGKPYWRIDLKRELSYDTNDGLSRLLEIIWPRRNEINEFVSRANLTSAFLSSVSIFYDRPVYSASSETIKKIAYLGAEWSLDIFDYRK